MIYFRKINSDSIPEQIRRPPLIPRCQRVKWPKSPAKRPWQMNSSKLAPLQARKWESPNPPCPATRISYEIHPEQREIEIHYRRVNIHTNSILSSRWTYHSKPFVVGTGVFQEWYINTMDTDALVPCVDSGRLQKKSGSWAGLYPKRLIGFRKTRFNITRQVWQ